MTEYTEKIEKFRDRVNKDMTTYENFKIVFGETTPDQDDMYKALSMVRHYLAISRNREHFNRLLTLGCVKKGTSYKVLYFARAYCANNGFEITNE